MPVPGRFSPELEGGAEPIVTEPRRHLDVHDCHVGLVRQGLPQEGLGVSGLADDIESGVGQQARNPFTQQNVVLPEDHPDGLKTHRHVIRHPLRKRPSR